MISQKLIEVLRCPETRQTVSLLDEARLRQVNQAITQQHLNNRSGQSVSEPLDAALVREDGRYAYPIRDGIPVLLVDEGIEIEAI
jgi:uncharacterized protein YbaR (Trm112 family)